MSAISRVRRTLIERKLIEPGMRVLVACSGGPDSAALLGLLAELAPELRLQLEAASVDHGLRPDAQLDVDIARRQATDVGIAFHALRVEVARGASVQAQARDARYAALHELARARGMHRIATGHTLDDQAETVLARLLRGTGVRGLCAIEPLRDDGVIRPLIDCNRNEVHSFTRDRFTSIAEDRSNHDLRFERARVRAELLPALRIENPALDQHLAQLADEARDVTAWLREQAAEVLARAQVDPETLTISVVQAASSALRPLVIRAWLEGRVESVSGAHLRQIVETSRCGHGEVWLSRTLRVCAHHDGTLRLQRRNESARDSRP